MSADVTYAPDRVGYRYGTPDDAYAKGYHRGQDVRKLNPDGNGSVVAQVDAVDGGRVVYVGRPNRLLELTVVIDTGRARGRYESHSHLADVIVVVGQDVVSGQRLARNAEMWETPGMVDGAHDHITVTDYFDGAWTTSRPEYDPLPFIQDAYARATGSLAGGDSTPFTPGGILMALTDDEQQRILYRTDAIYAGLFGPANVGVPMVTWAKPFGEPSGGAYYGVLDLLIYLQGKLAEQAAAQAGLAEMIRQTQGGTASIDLVAVQAAAEAGAKKALGQFPTPAQIADAVNDVTAERLKK